MNNLIFVIRHSKFVITFIFLYSFNTFAQSKKAVELYEKGNDVFKLQIYAQAATFFQKAAQIDSTYSDAFFQLGRCYELQKMNELAINTYLQVIKQQPQDLKYLPAHQFLASRYFKNAQYQEAKPYLAFCLQNSNSKSPIVKQLKRQIEQCDFAIEAIKNPLDISPKLLSANINLKTFQYFPILTADKETIFFTARAEKGDENLFSSQFKNQNWTLAEPLKIISTPLNEGTCTISADGKTMIFTTCEGRQSFGSCDLYISHFLQDAWQEPKNLGMEVNSSFWDSQPTLSADGRTLFFSSDRPNGKGGKDIWFCKLLENNTCTTAKNLGDSINTNFDEISPFLHANGKTLFFSSNGHVGLGGFDIFMSDESENIWQKPQNIGYPINNAKDQIGLSITADGEQAYYANDEKNTTQLFTFNLPDALKNRFKKANYLKGNVFDAKTKKALHAKIELFDTKNSNLISTFESDENGNYTSVLPNGSNYALYVVKDGYFFKSLSFDFSTQIGANGKMLDIYLEPILKNSIETLNNLFFDSGKWDLKLESITELQKLSNLLKQNAVIKIEISAHTDDIGSDADNLILSQKRANSVLNFLKKEGVSDSRLIAIGWGESKAKMPNISEENRKINRRIEIRIL